jgi:hypothetical protein
MMSIKNIRMKKQKKNIRMKKQKKNKLINMAGIFYAEKK